MTDEEHKKVVELMQKGLGYRRIAASMGISVIQKDSISYRYFNKYN